MDSTTEISCSQKCGTCCAPIRPMPWTTPLMIRIQASRTMIATEAISG